MIIFDLDDCLADCEHRRHFVDYHTWVGKQKIGSDLSAFKADWKSFYEACNKDTPIEPTIRVMWRLMNYADIQIWSGRCESVREKTIEWFDKNLSCFAPINWYYKNLKMRPIGDYTPQEDLFEKWLDEEIEKHSGPFDPVGWTPVKMVFSAHKPTIEMFRKRDIFVFDCNQEDF